MSDSDDTGDECDVKPPIHDSPCSSHQISQQHASRQTPPLSPTETPFIRRVGTIEIASSNEPKSSSTIATPCQTPDMSVPGTDQYPSDVPDSYNKFSNSTQSAPISTETKTVKRRPATPSPGCSSVSKKKRQMISSDSAGN